MMPEPTTAVRSNIVPTVSAVSFRAKLIRSIDYEQQPGAQQF
jgi:hypothetical protein